MPRTIRLRSVLVIFFLSASLLPLFLFGTLTAAITASYFTKQFTTANRQIADSIAFRIGDSLENAEQVLEHLGDSVFRTESSAVQELMDSLRYSFPFYDSFKIMDSRGSLVHISPANAGMIGYDMSRTEYFKKASEQPVFSKPFLSPATGALSLSLSYRKNDRVFAGTIRLSKLEEIVSTFYLGETGYVVITDGLGNVIAHPDGRYVRGRYNFSDRPYVKAARNAHGETVTYLSGGERRLATSSVMPSTGWTVTITQRKWDALVYLRSFLLILAAVVMSSIGISLIIAVLLRRRILTPMWTLQKSANRLAAGNYQETLEDARFEEFQAVLSAFNRMSRAIRFREDALSQSRERYRQLIEHANSIIIRWGTDFTYTFFNEYAQSFFGYTEDEVLGRSIIGITVPETETSGRDLENMLEDIISRPDSYKSNQNEVITRSGERRWIQWSNRPIYNEAGELTEILSIGTDRTEFRKAEEQINRSLREKEILLKEIHHRVKNNMQVISSLLNLQSHKMHDDRDIELFRESQNRVHSMALVHEQLYQSENLAEIDLKDFVCELANYMSDTYLGKNDDVLFDIQIEKRRMDLDYAIPAALIINELISNALKYAYPLEHKRGTIEIRIEEISAGGRTRIYIADDGAGMENPEAVLDNPGMGLQLVTALTQQLNGGLLVRRRTPPESGTVVTIEF